MKSKIFSALLVLCIIFSIVSVRVGAANDVQADNTQTGMSFTDVEESQWYYEAVSYVYGESLFNGTSDTTFEPETIMTRAMFVQVLANKTSNYDADRYKTPSFSDVKVSDWYAPAVEWASQNNIVFGGGDGKFSPKEIVTREQMTTILYRYASLTGNYVEYVSDIGQKYPDWIDVSIWARTPMEWAITNGILDGNTDGSLAPLKGARRCEVAQVFKNSEKILVENAIPETTGSDIFSQIPSEFVFASGIGAWSTVININPDGSFTGYYHDSDMGDTGPGYPNGTRYECNFAGKFTDVKKIDNYEYSMRVKYLITEEGPLKETIEDGIRIITSTPYGFDDADGFRLYLPGKEIRNLPEGFLIWTFPERDKPVLSCYGLYNVNGEQGFVSYDHVLPSDK